MQLKSRGQFLRSGAALLPLPIFESISSNPVLGKTQSPKRIIFLATGWGLTSENWFLPLEHKGHWKQLPKALKPLEKYKNDFSMVRNCYHKHSKDAHVGSTFWLTGANRFAIPGRNFHNTISVDQVTARHLGSETRFESIRLSAGQGVNQLSWDKNGKPLTCLRSPFEFYKTLFEEPTSSISQLKHELEHKKSILDIFQQQTFVIKKNLNKMDNEKLEEYLQSIRDVELMISKEEKWLSVPKKRPEEMPKIPSAADAPIELKSMIDLMIAAMQVDASRVFTYSLPIESFLKYFGTSISGHNMSHYGLSENRREISEKRDHEYVKGLLYLIEKLHSIRDEYGRTLFESTTVVFGSNIKTGHSLRDCTTFITGGGSGIQLGQHIIAEEKTPLCNVWLTLLQGMGLREESFGDSTDTLRELQG